MTSNEAGDATLGSSAPLERRSSLGYVVNHLARLFEQGLRRQIAGYGVVPGQFAQLLALYEEEPLTQRQLCDRVQIEQSTMAVTLQRMERDGLIRRTSDPTDGRRSLITLTPRARALRNALSAAARDVNATATQGMSDVDVDTVMRAVEQMIRNLEPTSGPRQQRAGHVEGDRSFNALRENSEEHS